MTKVELTGTSLDVTEVMMEEPEVKVVVESETMEETEVLVSITSISVASLSLTRRQGWSCLSL